MWSKIWSIHKKAVPLHPISRSTQASGKEWRKVLKNRNAENQPLMKKVKNFCKKVA